MPGGEYQLKITVRGAAPPGWRRLTVPGDVTLHELYQEIRAAFGRPACNEADAGRDFEIVVEEAPAVGKVSAASLIMGMFF